MTRDQIIAEIHKVKAYYRLEERSTEQLLAILRKLEDANRGKYAKLDSKSSQL